MELGELDELAVAATIGSEGERAKSDAAEPHDVDHRGGHPLADDLSHKGPISVSLRLGRAVEYEKHEGSLGDQSSHRREHLRPEHVTVYA
jgi:hypothetical protein